MNNLNISGSKCIKRINEFEPQNKILFVCLDYFPFSGACTNILKNILLCKHDKYSFEAHVLTIKYGPKQLDYEVINGIHIHRLLIYELVPYANGKKIFKDSVSEGIRYFWKKGWNEIVRKRFVRKEFLNEKISLLVKEKIVELSVLNFSAIIPISGQYNAVDACLQYKRVTSRKEKLVIYQLDPCSNNEGFSRLSKAARERFEQAMLNNANYIITIPSIYDSISKSLSEIQKQKYKVLEIPNVTSENIDPLKSSYFIDEHKNGRICCVYAGQLYKKIRDPQYTIRIFNSLKDHHYILYLVGIYEKDLPEECRKMDNIICLGKKSIQETKEILNESDILINIGNNVTNQIPSKIFEYISTGKPIINFHKSMQCPTLRYMEKYPCALNVLECEEQYEDNIVKIAEFIANNSNTRIDPLLIENLYIDCTPDYFLHALLQLL